MIVKDYKAFCSLLGEEPLSGNSKKAQMKQWEQFIQFHKQRGKHSFYIDKIYKEPIENNTTTAVGRKPIYMDHLSNILLDYLNRHNYLDSKTAYDWYKTLGMVNDNYSLSIDEIKTRIAEYLFTETEIINFIYLSSAKLRSILLSALEGLAKKNIIEYNRYYVVKYKNNKNWYRATPGDNDSIDFTKEEILDELNLKDYSEIYKKGIQNIFNENTQAMQNNYYGYECIRYKIEIKSNYTKTFDYSEILKEKQELNNLIIDYLKNKASEYETKWAEAYKAGEAKTAPIKYAHAQNILINNLIKIKPPRMSLGRLVDPYIDELYDVPSQNEKYILKPKCDLSIEEQEELIAQIPNQLMLPRNKTDKDKNVEQEMIIGEKLDLYYILYDLDERINEKELDNLFNI